VKGTGPVVGGVGLVVDATGSVVEGVELDEEPARSGATAPVVWGEVTVAPAWDVEETGA